MRIGTTRVGRVEPMAFIQVMEPESKGAAEATEYPRINKLSQGNP